MFVTNWISTTKIQKISEITNFFRHYFLSRTEVLAILKKQTQKYNSIVYRKYFREPTKLLVFFMVIWKKGRGSLRNPCLSLNDSAKIRQFPDTTKYQRVIRCDFQHAFNPKPVKQSNSPFCAPQLILFQKRKHRVKEKKT